MPKILVLISYYLTQPKMDCQILSLEFKKKLKCNKKKRLRHETAKKWAKSMFIYFSCVMASTYKTDTNYEMTVNAAKQL